MRTTTQLLVLLLLIGSMSSCSKKEAPSTPSATASPTGTTGTSAQPTAKPQVDGTAFRGVIKNVSLYSVPGHSDDLAMTLVVSIKNSGGPSVLQEWKLEVNTPTKGVPTGGDAVHVSGVVDLPGAEGKKVDLAKDDLSVKAAQTPVATGSETSGVLTFVLPKTTESSLSGNNTSVMVRFKDSQGLLYWTPKTFIGAKKKLQ